MSRAISAERKVLSAIPAKSREVTESREPERAIR